MVVHNPPLRHQDALGPHELVTRDKGHSHLSRSLEAESRAFRPRVVVMLVGLHHRNRRCTPDYGAGDRRMPGCRSRRCSHLYSLRPNAFEVARRYRNPPNCHVCHHSHRKRKGLGFECHPLLVSVTSGLVIMGASSNCSMSTSFPKEIEVM